MAQAFTGLPLHDLIGGPLMAAAEANNQMAVTQLRALLTVGFSAAPDTADETSEKVYKPVMVSIMLSRPALADAADQAAGPRLVNTQATLQIPLLSILPITALGLKRLKLAFDLEVLSAYSRRRTGNVRDEPPNHTSYRDPLRTGASDDGMLARVSHNQASKTDRSDDYRKSNDAHYHVECEAEQLALPDGLKILLQAFANAIGPTRMPMSMDERER
jgi:hypothetical protein